MKIGRSSRVIALVATALFAATRGGTACADEVVGAVGAANLAPTGRAPGHATRTLKPGSDIFFKDRIVTKQGGSAQLMFLDRSTLNVGENSDLVIDEFVYRPGTSGTMRTTLAKGVLRFVGGEVSHGGGATIQTPTVTIGIRGGIGTIGYVEDAGRLHGIPGVPADFRGGTIVVNGYGTLTVQNAASEMVVTRPGFAVFVGSTGAPIAKPVRLDMAAARALTTALTSKQGRPASVSGTAAASIGRTAAFATHAVTIPVAIPRPPSINALDFTSVFSAGNSLTRTHSQGMQSVQLHQQLVTMPSAAIPVATANSTATATTASFSLREGIAGRGPTFGTIPVISPTGAPYAGRANPSGPNGNAYGYYGHQNGPGKPFAITIGPMPEPPHPGPQPLARGP